MQMSVNASTPNAIATMIPDLLEKVTGMIGKGKRSEDVRKAIMEQGAVYFAAVGGAGALLSKCIRRSEVVAYDDLGTEAIRKLTVDRLPVIVIMDSQGNNLYESAVNDYLAKYANR